MKSVLTAYFFSQALQPASPLSIAPNKSQSTRQSSLFVPPNRRHSNPRSGTALKASTFAPNGPHNPWAFLRFPNFQNVKDEDRDVSLLSLEGGATKVTTWPNLLSIAKEKEVMDNTFVEDIHTLSETFSNLQSSIDTKSTLYEETLSTYRTQIINLQEENSFLEEGMRMLTLTLEKQADEIAKLNNERYEAAFVHGLQEDNALLRSRVRGLEVELSDFAFESRKIAVVDSAAQPVTAKTEPVENSLSMEQVENPIDQSSSDLTPKAPTAPIPQHILYQRQVDQLQRQLQEYESERASLRKLVGLCFKRATNKVGRAMNMWRPVYLLLADAKRGVFA
jgi:hypothetical protein